MNSINGRRPGRLLREVEGPPVAEEATGAQFALGLLGGKWVVPIICALASNPRRHSELRRALGPRLHEKVLTETLRRMEAADLIRRDVVPNFPPSVSYSLTDTGRSLLEPIHHLSKWTLSYRLRSQPEEHAIE